MSTCCLTTLLDASLGNTWVPLILKATQPFKSPKATRHSSCSQANAPALSNTSHMLVLDTGRAGLWRRLKVGLQRRPAAWGVVQVDFFFTSSISSDHSDMKLEINHEKNRKRMNTWSLNNQLQTKQNRNHEVMTKKKREGKMSKYRNIYFKKKKTKQDS